MKESKNKNLFLALTELKDIEHLKDEELLKVANMISNDINLNGLKRAISNACLKLSTITEKTANLKDVKERLEKINKLLNNQNDINANVRRFRRNKKEQNSKEQILVFIQKTMETLKIVKMYQETKENKIKIAQKEETEDKKIKTKILTAEITTKSKSK